MTQALTLSLFAVLASSGCNNNDCQEGYIGCNDDVIELCEAPKEGAILGIGYENFWTPIFDCQPYGAICQENVRGFVPEPYEDKFVQIEDAACVVAGFTCNDGMINGCLDHAIVACGDTVNYGVIESTMDHVNDTMESNNYLTMISLYTECVESEALGRALYVITPEPCDDGQSRCRINDSRNGYLLHVCHDGFWTEARDCRPEKCVHLSENEATCR